MPTSAATAIPSPTGTPSPVASATTPPVVTTLTVPAQTTRETTVKTAASLELEARLDATTAGDPAEVMQVRLNGQLIRQAVTNRSLFPVRGDGSTFNLYNPESSRWAVLFSPDYVAHDRAASGTKQITSNSGQAYRYVWDVSAQKGTAGTMTLRIDNATVDRAPLLLRITQR